MSKHRVEGVGLSSKYNRAESGRSISRSGSCLSGLEYMLEDVGMLGIKVRAGFALALLMAAPMASASSFTFDGTIFADYGKSIAAGGGCIYGSVGTTHPGKNFNFIVTFAAEANVEKDRKRAYFGFSTLDKRHDFDDGDLRASVFRMCLKPGNYRLVGIDALGMHNTKRVYVPFTVEANKHFYIGSFLFHSATSAPARCKRPVAPVFVEYRDEHVRDLPVIMKSEKFGGIEPEVRVMDPAAGYPYFQSCR